MKPYSAQLACLRRELRLRLANNKLRGQDSKAPDEIESLQSAIATVERAETLAEVSREMAQEAAKR